MSIRPLGPEGVQRRMRELERKLDEQLGRPSFEPLLSQAHSGLTGPIAGGSAGTAPLNPFASGVSVEGGPVAPENLKGLIHQSATDAGIDPSLFEALVSVESGFNTRAVSERGAKGLSQLMPGTAAALGVSDAFDPAQNLRGGARYLAQMIRQFGDTRLALAAYNAGPGTVARAGGIPPNSQTPGYVEQVLARARLLGMR